MLIRLLCAALGLYLLFAAWWVISAGMGGDKKQVILLNVSCDPTRELWRQINSQFLAHYRNQVDVPISIRQSHGGSASQARAVIDGLDADVVTLALWSDTDAVRKAGLIEPGWEDRLPNRALPYESTIVFVVRKGNPKQIRDWPDLAKPDVTIITPNPKTSGNGKWSFLAMWGSVIKRGGTEAEAREYVDTLFRKVPVLDTSARGATMTFAQKHLGDVHLTWENEAFMEVQESRGKLEIIYPSISVLAEPHVAVVDAVVKRKGTETIAKDYMQFLYTPEIQEIIGKNYFRPTNPDVRARMRDRFPEIPLFPARDLGTWPELQKRFFAEGGVFDQIFASGSSK